jgi:hypothetical protein
MRVLQTVVNRIVRLGLLLTLLAGTIELQHGTGSGVAHAQHVPMSAKPPALRSSPSAAARFNLRISVPGERWTQLLRPGGDTALTVEVTNGLGKPIRGAGITFVAPESGPSGRFRTGATSSAIVLRERTGTNGLATAFFSANSTRGGYLVDALVDGADTAASFAVTNVARRAVPAHAGDIARLVVRQDLLHNAPDGANLRLYGPVLLDAGTRVSVAGPGRPGYPATSFSARRRRDTLPDRRALRY